MSNTRSNRSVPKNWVRMLYLGDSLTFGARDPYRLAWPYYMAQCAIRDDVVILPKLEAENGRLTPELVRVALPVIETSDAKEVFILIGTNDCKDEIALPAAEYEASIHLLINWCRVLGLREYVLTNPLPTGFGSPGYTSAIVERIQEYNQTLRLMKLPRLIECEDVTEKVDGIHLAANAAKEIGRRAWAAVKAERTFG